ncbi:GGDEF domain-containing protein [Thermosulfurimonas marina]|uniref:diguanylate cyclase n=1 Tax=Thermosulfurimonas marina TaxID=2047767 RepID=A0A6H1WU06_9BACT|nr:GGDEF domain-containing protein [Thermosulfurimonas marina]QJA06705.1 GGDEF domain-containing protein [Thermosulfurimonas marina]
MNLASDLPEKALFALRELYQKVENPSFREKLDLIRQAYEVLYQEYSKDFLTGLYNRRSFEEALEKAIERARREEISFTLLMLDIDHFKKINDTYGHDFGDQVLRTIGQILLKTLRKIDFPARYGGEEFTVILPGTGPHGGFGAARRLKRAIESYPFEGPQGRVKITVSIGGATYRPYYRLGAREFLREVDRLLYSAKEAGRNAIAFKAELEPAPEGLTQAERALLFRGFKDER